MFKKLFYFIFFIIMLFFFFLIYFISKTDKKPSISSLRRAYEGLGDVEI